MNSDQDNPTVWLLMLVVMLALMAIGATITFTGDHWLMRVAGFGMFFGGLGGVLMVCGLRRVMRSRQN